MSSESCGISAEVVTIAFAKASVIIASVGPKCMTLYSTMIRVSFETQSLGSENGDISIILIQDRSLLIKSSILSVAASAAVISLLSKVAVVGGCHVLSFLSLVEL